MPHLRLHSPPYYLTVFLLLFIYSIITLTLPRLTPSPTSHPSSSFPSPSHLSFAAAAASSTPLPPALIWAQLIHRHGDRTPIHPLPNTTAWQHYQLPPGSLTSIGWAQHQAVGRWALQRYAINTSGAFLDPHHYHPRSLSVRSTEVERCLQSVTALLSTMYPPVLNHSAVDATEAARRTTLPPYPPVFVMPMPLDALLQATDKCPSYALTYPDTQRASDALINSLYPTLHATILSLSNLSSTPVAPSAAMTISWAADNLLCEKAHNLSSSADLTAMHPLLTELSGAVSYARFVGDVREAKGSIGDLLLRDVARSMLHRVRVEEVGEVVGGDGDGWADSWADERLRIYSAHDTTVVSLLASLHLLTNSSFYLLPPYATVMSVNLRRTAATAAGAGRYVVDWRIGFPVLVKRWTADGAGKEGGRDGDGDVQEERWEMQDEALAVPCPMDDAVERGGEERLQEECDLASFLRFVLIHTNPSYDSSDSAFTSSLPTTTTSAAGLISLLGHFPPYAPLSMTALYTYPPNDGCCVPPPDLALRCPTPLSYHQSSSACQLLRRLCPDVACGQGMTVAVGSFACVSTGAGRVELVKDGALLGCSLVVAALLCVIGWQCRRGAGWGVSGPGVGKRRGYEEVADRAAVSGTGETGEEEARGGVEGGGDSARSQVMKGGEAVLAMVEKARAGLKERARRKKKRRQERGNEEEKEQLEMTGSHEDDEGEDEEEEEGEEDDVRTATRQQPLHHAEQQLEGEEEEGRERHH